MAMILDDRIEGEVDMLEKHLVLSGKEEGKKHRELAKWAGALESFREGDGEPGPVAFLPLC